MINQTRSPIGTPLKTLAGATLLTSRGAPLLVWDEPLDFVPAPPPPTATEPTWPQAVLTSYGAPLRTAAGALLLLGRIPPPALLPFLPDPQSTRVAPPRSLATALGAPIYTSAGTLLFPGQIPLPARQFLISGVTRNNGGAPLGNCALALYLTTTGQLVDRTTSDGSGNYSFATAGPAEAYFVVAYLIGSPDVTGSTVNTVTGT